MNPPRVKLITGILYPSDNENLLNWAISELAKLWGQPELFSKSIPFDKTNYYDEISPNLNRIFMSFPGLFYAGDLADWKHQAINIESLTKHNHNNIRSINIDPGYIDGARLILASTKDHAHRIYLRDGIFAEVTLRYRFKNWQSFDYTFPDFQSRCYDDFLSQVRKLWLKEIKEVDLS
ncbi:MAG: DUF4416 family protein [Synergistaceae bacterium]|nr:DUF4416 family protein [Synergistaceae bacterium]